MIEYSSLQHTRGISLRNLCFLCSAMQGKDHPVSQRELMLLGRDIGLSGFEKVRTTGPLPTRVRHHDYALNLLELVESKESLYILTDKGNKLALTTRQTTLKPSGHDAETSDVSLPGDVKAQLREIICSSNYVRHWWLRYFMPREEFSLDELISESKNVVIELVPSNMRTSTKTSQSRDFEDSGYRVHSYFSAWQTLQLNQSGRREVHEGLRQWCSRLDLVDEVSGWAEVFEIEPEFAQKLESSNSRLDRAYIVRQRWDATKQIEQFELLLSKYMAETGNATRMHIPNLIITLALQEGVSLKDIRDMLCALYREKHSQYFFESASELLLKKKSNKYPLDTYIQIDGAWRTSIIVSI